MPSLLRFGLCVVLAVPVLRGQGISEATLAPPAAPATRAPQPTPSQAPVSYRLTFPEPEHHWLQAEVTFPDVGSAPLQVRMSRSSPGRYALHEFAKNVFDVHAFDGSGRELSVSQPNLHQWDVPGHDGTVRIAYRLFGDVVDGTYLAVDTTHAHLNMPATLMWARGLEDRPATVRFEPPAARRAWNVATQLFPSSEPGTFTAPNLQYLMDSPSEFSAFTMRRFTVGDGVEFRVAVHHDGSEAEVERYAEDVKKIVEQAGRVYLEFPAFDVGYYTFIADYLPWAEGDGMEHRNSTVLASSGALRNPRERVEMLGTAAHEVFHCWNVERIRPASLEPFNFEEANISGELWLAEGFTSYYGPLLMHRAGLSDLGQVLRSLADGINAVTSTPGRRFRSAVDMSRQAPFVDGARSVDRTNRDTTFLSYYTYGAAIGLGLDLALRDYTNGRVSLDDFMRAMWVRHGKPGGPAPGLVGSPYTLQDVRDRLAEVSAPSFADTFFNRYIAGRDVIDYARLLARAGILARKAHPGRAWLGDVTFDFSSRGATVTGPTISGTPAYIAGLDREDVLVSLDEQIMSSQERLSRVLARHKPGESVSVVFLRRAAETVKKTMVLQEDPRVELVPVEQGGGQLGTVERAFREEWLGRKSS